LNGDFPFDDVTVEKSAQLLGQVFLNAQSDVVEVDQQGGVRGMYLGLT
jgi:hypothetical protein